jgi:hypothetical protein
MSSMQMVPADDIESMSLAQLRAEAAILSPSRSSQWSKMRVGPLRAAVAGLRALDAIPRNIPAASPAVAVNPSLWDSLQSSTSRKRAEIAASIVDAQADLDAVDAELRQLQFQRQMAASSPPPLVPLPSTLRVPTTSPTLLPLLAAPARRRPMAAPVRLKFLQKARPTTSKSAVVHSPPSSAAARIAQLEATLAQARITQLEAAITATRLPGPPSLTNPHPSSHPPLNFGRGQFAGATSAPAGDSDVESDVASEDDNLSTLSAMGPHVHPSTKAPPSHASATALRQQILDRHSNHEPLSVQLLATLVSRKTGFEFFGADFEAYNYRRSNAARRSVEMSIEISKSGDPQTTVSVGPWQSLGELEVFAHEQTSLAIASSALKDHAALQTALQHLQPFFRKVTSTYISVVGPQGMVVNGRPCQWSDHAELLAGFMDLWLYAMASRDFSLLSTDFPAAMASIYLRLSSNNGMRMRLGVTWRQVMLLSGHQCGSRVCGSNNGCCDEVCITCTKPRLDALGSSSSKPNFTAHFNSWGTAGMALAAKLPAYKLAFPSREERQSKPAVESMSIAQFHEKMALHQNVVGPPANLRGVQPLAYYRQSK